MVPKLKESNNHKEEAVVHFVRKTPVPLLAGGLMAHLLCLGSEMIPSKRLCHLVVCTDSFGVPDGGCHMLLYSVLQTDHMQKLVSALELWASGLPLKAETTLAGA